MKTQKHSGAAHLIIVTIILALGLVGAMGYVVWDKVINKDQDSSSNVQENNNSTVDDKKALVDGSTDEVATDPYEGWKTVTENVTGKKLSLKYPESWKLDSKTSANGTKNGAQYITIKSPDDDISVVFYANLFGVGGTCGEGYDDPAFKIIEVNKYNLDNFPGYTLYSLVTDSNSGHNYRTALYEDNDFSENLKIGESGCNGTVSVFKTDEIYNSLSIIISSFNFEHDYSLDEIHSLIDSENYKIAVEIARSLYTK